MIRPDAWLARVLERPVFAVVPEPGAAGAEAAAAELRTHAAGPGRGGLYFAKVPCGEVATVGALETAGMRVVDVNVTFGADAARLAAALGAGGACEGAGPGAVDVRPLGPDDPPGDAEAVLDIAGSCFRYSRFHLDPQLEPGLADRIKREWIASYVRGARGVELLVARREGVPVGFLAVVAAGDGPRAPRVIDLVGVGAGAQRSGAGSALVRAFALRHAPHCDELRVGTQAANLPSLAFYERNGFRIVGTSYVLHLHARGAPS